MNIWPVEYALLRMRREAILNVYCDYTSIELKLS